TACLLNDTAAMLSPTTKKIVFVTDSVYINQINNKEKTGIDLTLNHFTPNSFHFVYSAKANTFLVLNQNRYPFWQITIDGQKTPIVPVNSSFMGVAIPAGKHLLHFDFKANHILIALYINLFIIFLFIFFVAFRKKLAPHSR
ncbi:MAG: YfhO family protein, partial [Niastella sp.]|uniref:YfhO family protein n=1 Tax=Niastella sp. TaxID=1869183 RepID=UPI00389AA63B